MSETREQDQRDELALIAATLRECAEDLVITATALEGRGAGAGVAMELADVAAAVMGADRRIAAALATPAQSVTASPVEDGERAEVFEGELATLRSMAERIEAGAVLSRENLAALLRSVAARLALFTPSPADDGGERERVARAWYTHIYGGRADFPAWPDADPRLREAFRAQADDLLRANPFLRALLRPSVGGEGVATKRPATMHSFQRTSPMGEQFIGRCVLCGAAGLTAADMAQECPNPTRVSEDHALLDALADTTPATPTPADDGGARERVITGLRERFRFYRPGAREGLKRAPLLSAEEFDLVDAAFAALLRPAGGSADLAPWAYAVVDDPTMMRVQQWTDERVPGACRLLTRMKRLRAVLEDGPGLLATPATGERKEEDHG